MLKDVRVQLEHSSMVRNVSIKQVSARGLALPQQLSRPLQRLCQAQVASGG